MKQTPQIYDDYQKAIDKFKRNLELIDNQYGTYVILDYCDVTIRHIQVHGIDSKPRQHTRKIEIESVRLLTQEER